MKINFKRLAVCAFLSFTMVNVAMAEDGPTCPSLQGSQIWDARISIFGKWTAYYNLDKSPFDGGSIETTGENEQETMIIAEAAFITTKAGGNARKIPTRDGRYFFACSTGNNNYNLVSGTTYIFLSTPTYVSGLSLTSEQNLAPVQLSIEEKYELLKNTLNR